MEVGIPRPARAASEKAGGDKRHTLSDRLAAKKHELEQLSLEMRSKDVAMETLQWRLKGSEGEAVALRQRMWQLEEAGREREVRMALLQEEASHSLSSMVAAQRERRREEERRSEKLQQLELQVASQAEELSHLRLQLTEEIQAHRYDVADCNSRAQAHIHKLEAELRAATGERDRAMEKSASQPNIVSLSYPPLSSRHRPSQHPPLLRTVSEDPPSFPSQLSPFHTLQPLSRTYGHSSYTLPRLQSQYERAPATFHTGVSTFHGCICYFSSFMTNQIHAYDTAEGAWQLLPECPVSNFGLEVIGGLITTIGGRLATTHSQKSECTNRLLSLKEEEGAGPGDGGRRWVEKLPAMTLPRAQPATTSNRRLVIVAGGEMGDHKSFIANIEVLLLETGAWSRVSASPLGNYSWLTAVLCEGQLVLVEGSGARERDKVHTLPMGALVQALQEQTAGDTGATKPANLPWKRVRQTPASNTTCVWAKGKLIAVGGIRSDGKSTNEIWAYNESADLWKSIGNLKSHRYRALVGVTATGSLLVIGGLTKTKLTDRMEVFDSF